ncbi:hypothetical protein AHAS_Ahas19G0214400 [Arachis hypogaea]
MKVSTATHFLAAFVYHLSATSNAAAIAFSELLRRGSAFFVTFNRECLFHGRKLRENNRSRSRAQFIENNLNEEHIIGK